MKHLFAYYLLFLSLIFCCCEDGNRSVPLLDDTIPLPVTDVRTTSIAGGANIVYTLPQKENILYVMAEYRSGNGTLQNKKASYFDNQITIEGFPDTREYDVNVYTVSRGGIRSQPVTVQITPLTPPVVSVFESFKIQPTFGGVKVLFGNETEANLKMVVLTTDSIGNYYTAYTHYTKRKSGDFSVRGFESEERSFGFYILDRWNNYSDTIFMTLTPWFEEQLDKDNFEFLRLPTDTYEQHGGFSLANLWNDVWGTDAAFHTKPNTGIPQWFTFDLGVRARLSRFKFYHRLSGNSGANSDGQYSAGDPKIIEIYGSNNPNSDGSWDSSWELLGHFESVKPSGSATWTDEDIQYACHDGEDFEFTNDTPVRYLRFKTLKNWGGVSYIYMAELTFWGEVIEEY